MVTFWLLVAVSLIQSLAPSKALIQDDFISSNDTIKLRLFMSASTTKELTGPPGSKVNFDFILQNNMNSGVFSLRQLSEDGFLGEIKEDNKILYLESDSEKVIRVSNLVVPSKKNGEKATFTLILEKQAAATEAEKGWDESYNVPGYRSNTSVTIEFTVTTSEKNDGETPQIKLNTDFYSNKACPVTYKDPDCDKSYWQASFFVRDEESGIRKGTVHPIGNDPFNRSIYYRHTNFPIGSTKQQELITVASCCLRGIRVRAFDAAGNEETLGRGGYLVPRGLKKPAIYGAISGVATFLLIISSIFMVVFFVQKKKASSVHHDFSTNDAPQARPLLISNSQM